MERNERLYKINYLLKGGRCVRPAELLAALEVSPATLKRDVQFMRDRLQVPLEWCRERRGWHLQGSSLQEMPGLWLGADDVYALLTMQQLLASLDRGGPLSSHIGPLMRKFSGMLRDGGPPQAELARRIRVKTVSARRMHLPHFQVLGSALLQRKRARLVYRARSDGQVTDREVSPQRLVHYRDNWHLQAWCHEREALRDFSVDAVESAHVVDREALELPESELDDWLGAGYGIFAGTQTAWATLRFSPRRARWVAAERWHADQVGRWDAEGRWLLSVPYADPRELVMDILRHVPDVEVIGPDELRVEVLRRLKEGVALMALDE